MGFALDIDNLACVRGQRLLFKGLSFRVEEGHALSLEGSNGTGKTSLLRMIAGFLRPYAGTIRLRTGGKDIVDGEERGGFVGWLGHHDAVKPQMTVAEQISFFARLYGGNGDQQAAMERFGILKLADLPGQYLSAGQKRRLALARLSLSTRPLWLLDEPLAALDMAGKGLVGEAVAAHCATGGIVVAATHEALGIACERLRLEPAR